MRLKYITKFFLVAACGLVTFAACSDEYLDKKVDVSETQEKVYSDSAKVAGVVNGFYGQIGYSHSYKRFGQCGLDFPAKELEARGAELSMGMYLAQGTVNVNNAGNDAWNNTYNKWRAINIFMNNYNEGKVAAILSSDPNNRVRPLLRAPLNIGKDRLSFFVHGL